MMNDYEITVVKCVPHPSGTDNCHKQFFLRVQLTDAECNKVIAAIANEINYISELNND